VLLGAALLPVPSVAACGGTFAALGQDDGGGHADGGGTDGGGSDGGGNDGSPDAPSEVSLDASSDSGDPSGDTGSTTVGDGAQGPAPASCLDVRQSTPLAASGVYVLTVDGQTFDAYCDMALDGGGWTVFFAGLLGAANVFAHFDVPLGSSAPTDNCASPGTRCLRHIPNAVTMATEFAATCGDAAVKFMPTPAVLDFFRAGVSRRWVPVSNVTALSGNAITAYASLLWTGDGQYNESWILSADDAEPGVTSHTFASSYYSGLGGWDFCNGADYNSTNATPMVKLLYR
jgi:hypothetical protein